MAYPWLKLYGSEYLSDAKILSLSAASRSCWITLLCYASISSEPGVVRHVTEDLLMVQAGVDAMRDEWNETKEVLNRFENLEMISIREDGSIEILNWEKRQDSFLTDAERAARYRSRHGKRDGSVTEVTLEKNREDKDKRRIEKNVYTDEFEKFWKVYPKRVGKSKAFELWKKLTPQEKKLVMADIPERMKDEKWMGGFIKDPERYIKSRQWEDEIRVKSSKVTSDKF